MHHDPQTVAGIIIWLEGLRRYLCLLERDLQARERLLEDARRQAAFPVRLRVLPGRDEVPPRSR